MLRPTRLLAVIAAFVMGAGVLSIVGASPALADTTFKVDCAYSHTAADDPIVYPGQPGASHLHDFFGNASTNAYSTYASMDGVTSTCTHNDRAAYWAPTLYRNGQVVHSDGTVTYYTKTAYKEHIEAFPKNFMMIEGNKNATTSAQQSTHVYWGCEDDSRISYTRREPPDTCSPSNGIMLRIEFPSCWDGVTVPGDEAANHMRYPSGGNCPSGYPHVFPMIGFHVTYQFHNASTGNITFSSGNVYSAHMDFLNTWDQTTLQTLIDNCSNAQNTGGGNCGHFTGREKGSPGKAAPPVDKTQSEAGPVTGSTGTGSASTPSTKPSTSVGTPVSSTQPATTAPDAGATVASGNVTGTGSGKCVWAPNTTSGTQAQLWACNTGANQQISQKANGELQLAGKCLDAEGAAKTAGTKVILWDCSGNSNQLWKTNTDGTITGVASGLCLDAEGAGTANQTPLVIWTCNKGTNQQWSKPGATAPAAPPASNPPSTQPVTTTTTSSSAPPATGGSTDTGSANQPTKNITVPASLGVHDPSRIINDNGSYYFYGTSGNLSGWYTTDGKNWKQTPAVFKNGLPSSILQLVPVNNGVWAPDVIYSPTLKVFLMYYSIANWDDPKKSAIGLVTSPTLNPNAANYKWTDHGVVISRTDATGSTIDPAPFYDTAGNLWLSYGSGYSSVNRTHGINIIALDKNTGLRSDNTVHTQLSCGCEGSYVQPHDGYYYLFWNTGGCCSGAASTYTIHVARSTSVTGPYTENSSKFFSSTGNIHGPGHIGILSENGKDYYSYHYYPNSGGSVLGLGTITWSGGWPHK
jgi:arabinan endo-1,5-alpha-L-arabinosidase